MSHPSRGPHPSSVPQRRSPAPWLFGLAAVLTVLAPFLFALVWIIDGTAAGFVPALVAALVDLFAAILAALAGTVVAARRGIVRVRTAVTGHPQGRAGRLAEYQAARSHLARDRFAALRHEWAAFESDRGAVAARPAMTDVSVPATARFVEAFGDAERLIAGTESGAPGHGDLAAAVVHAVAAWHEAQRVADEIGPSGRAPSGAGVSGAAAGATWNPDEAPTRAVEPPGPGAAPRNDPGHAGNTEYAEVADAVRKAARRGMEDLRNRLRS